MLPAAILIHAVVDNDRLGLARRNILDNSAENWHYDSIT